MKAKPCRRCGGLDVLRDKAHDVHYCGRCNVWLEPTCDDPNCDFCLGRPEKPLYLAVVEKEKT